MLYALNSKNEKVKATPRAKSICPLCGESLIAKCGSIKSWHWSHQRNDCDSWYEPETEWHLGWKRLVDSQYTEVVMSNHRADIIGNNGLVIELQNSPISVEEIQKREQFYGNMIWVFNAEKFLKNLFIETFPDYRLSEILMCSSDEPDWETIDPEERYQYLYQMFQSEEELNRKRKKGDTQLSSIAEGVIKIVLDNKAKEEDARRLKFSSIRNRYVSQEYIIETPFGTLPTTAVKLKSISWKHPRISHFKISKPVIYDLGKQYMLYVSKFDDSYYYEYFSGYLINTKWFITNFLSDILAF